MVSLIPGLRHGHAPAVERARQSYAFAESVVRADGPWCKQSSATIADGVAQVEFIATKTLDRALLCSTTDLGITGNRKWIESSAKLEKSSDKWIASRRCCPLAQQLGSSMYAAATSPPARTIKTMRTPQFEWIGQS